MIEPYRDDLAYIHDAGFGHTARAAAPFLLEALERRRVRDGLVIDLGCGSGILSEAVSAAGLFRRVHDALLPDGLFLLDVAGPGRAPGPEPRRGYAEGEDWAVFFTIEEDRVRRRLTRRITTFRKEGDLYRRDAEVHEQRLFPPSEVAGLLRAVGFRARTLSGYGEKKFPPGLAGFLARRHRRPRSGEAP
jgi:hypothetical protein